MKQHPRLANDRMRLTLLISVFLTTPLLFNDSRAADDVLFRNGHNITLLPSAKYAAIQLGSGVLDTDVRLTGVLADKTRGRVSNAPILKTHRLILLRTNEPLNIAAPSGPRFTSVPAAIGTAVPVFSLGGVDVILTNEILFKPKPEAKAAVLKNLSFVGEATKTNDRDLYALTVKKGSAAALELANSLARDSEQITYAEPNFIVVSSAPPRVVATLPPLTGLAPIPPAPGDPTDPYFRQQWWLKNTGVGGTKAGADVRAVPAWTKADGTNITIAILDVGVDENHPDLKQKLIHPYDAISKIPNQQPNSWDGHGTACAGIAAAITNNGLGVSSIAKGAKIMPVRIATSPGENQEWITDYKAIARGIDWAVENGADVISSSWGGGIPDPAVEDSINNGVRNGRSGRGVVFIFAAGNTGENVVWPGTLALSLPVITVGATNEWDELKTVNSNDGEKWWASNIGTAITVFAPGVHLFTTDISGAAGYVAGDYFGGFNGTSGAAPIVAGVAALILSQDPSLKAADVKTRLHDSADTIAAGPRVNACKALGAPNC